MKLLSQKSMLLAYLRKGKSITTYEAFTKGFGVKLPNLISELSEKGIIFNKVWNVSNTGKRHLSYSIKKDNKKVK